MKIGSIVIHCHDFDRTVAFWQAALHYVAREPAKDGWDVGGEFLAVESWFEEVRTGLFPGGRRIRTVGSARGLSAGGRRIRTLGPAKRNNGSRLPRSASWHLTPPRKETDVSCERDRGSNLASARRRVSCEPDFLSLTPPGCLTARRSGISR